MQFYLDKQNENLSSNLWKNNLNQNQLIDINFINQKYNFLTFSLTFGRVLYVLIRYRYS